MLNDDLDRRLLYELRRDGTVSVPALSKQMGISTSVLYSRIKRLSKKKIIKKFTILVDDSLLGMKVRAEVGINRNPKLKKEIHRQLMRVPEVISVTEVTGRFDILLTLRVSDLQTLHSVVIDKISKIDGIQNTETFVELERTDKDPEYIRP